MIKPFKLTKINTKNNTFSMGYMIIDTTENDLPCIKISDKDNAEIWLDYLNNQDYYKNYYLDETIKCRRRINKLLTENYHLKQYNDNLINTIKKDKEGGFNGMIKKYIMDKKERGLNVEVMVESPINCITIEKTDKISFEGDFIKVNDDVILNIQKITCIE